MTTPSRIDLAWWIVATATLGALLPSAAATAAPATSITATSCDHSTSILMTQHDYTIAARVRPLLFWVRRDNVGDARVTINTTANGGRTIALLIGSDPERTPMRINRWGYVAETACRGVTTVVGVMTESDEQSVEEAQAHVGAVGEVRHAYKAILASHDAGISRAVIIRLAVREIFTYRDVDTVLNRVCESRDLEPRMVAVSGANTGFLGALEGLVQETVEAWAAKGPSALATRRRRLFVHGDQVAQLSVGTSTITSDGSIPSSRHGALIESEFEVRNPATQRRSTFRMTYGTEGAFAAVPIRIVYRPRWWFEVELRLIEGPGR